MTSLPRILAAIATLLLCACATTPTPRPTIARGDVDAAYAFTEARVHEEMARAHAEVVAVAIVDASGVKWAKVFGRDDVTLDSHFRVGSLSKLMTSLAALSLRDDKKLDLDAPVVDVLPWFSVRHRFDTKPITPRLLMTHHAGLPSNILRGMYGDGSDPDAPHTFLDHVRMARDVDMVTPAGTVVSYSDLGFTVMGAVVEKAGGAPFADVVKARVFEPLGLTRTTFVPTQDVIPAIVDGARLVENPPLTVPANGLVTTPSDLARVASSLLDPHSPLRARFDEAMTPSSTTALDLDWRTGFGLNENKAFAPDVGPVYWHSGQTLAFTAELVVCPSANVGVVVMTNTREAVMLPSTIAWDALAAVLQAKRGTAHTSLWGAGVDAPTRAASFTQRELESFAGAYPTEYGLITLERDGDHLRGRAFDEVFELIPTNRRTFLPRVLAFGALPVDVDLLRNLELSFDFVDVAGKKTRALVSHQRGLRVLRGVRVEPLAKPLSPAWRARLSRWKNEQRAHDQITVDDFDLTLDDDGFLLARIRVTHAPKPLVVPLVPLDDDTAITAGVGRYLGETLRITRDADGRERLQVLGYALTR